MLTTYKILSSILLPRLNPYAEKIIEGHQCGFRRNRSTIDNTISIRQIRERKCEHTESVHQQFTHFKKIYDLVRMEFCLIFSLRLVSNATGKDNKNVPERKLWQSLLGKHLSQMFPTKNILKQGDVLSPLLSNLV